jgi:YggT family protein
MSAPPHHVKSVSTTILHACTVVSVRLGYLRIPISGGAPMDAIIVPFLNLIIAALQIYVWCLLISVILSWLVAFKVINTSNRFVYMVGDFLYRITEPALGRIRRFLPNLGGVDVSPIVLILLIFFVQEILGRLAFKFY